MQLPSLSVFNSTVAHRFGPHAPSEGPTGLIAKADPFRRRAPFATSKRKSSSSFLSSTLPHASDLNASRVPTVPPMPITLRTRGLGPRIMDPPEGSEERVEYEQYVLVRF